MKKIKHRKKRLDDAIKQEKVIMAKLSLAMAKFFRVNESLANVLTELVILYLDTMEWASLFYDNLPRFTLSFLLRDNIDSWPDIWLQNFEPDGNEYIDGSRGDLVMATPEWSNFSLCSKGICATIDDNFDMRGEDRVYWFRLAKYDDLFGWTSDTFQFEINEPILKNKEFHLFSISVKFYNGIEISGVISRDNHRRFKMRCMNLLLSWESFWDPNILTLTPEPIITIIASPHRIITNCNVIAGPTQTSLDLPPLR
jgi:hypothetical protein